MNFGQHIYLIKSDQERINQITKDWESNTYRFLELMLSRLSGEEIKINEISCKDLDVEAIYSPFTLLIPVVSQELLNSPTFQKGIKLFHKKARNKDHNNISWNSRIFKVIPTPPKDHSLLDYLSDSVSYDFFHYDTSTDELVIYNDFIDPASEKTYWMRLYDIAYDIRKVMDNLKNVESGIANISNELNSINIYLSEVGSDLITQRDALKRELLRNGYRVLPGKNMPKDLGAIMKLVKDDLASSNMSIHLIGSDPGKIHGSNVSILEIQNRLATKYFNELSKKDARTSLNLGRVIWVSPGLSNISVKQKLFIENLKKDSDSQRMADLLETTIEELKAFLNDKIQNGIKQHNRIFRRKKPAKGQIIYLIHDNPEAGKSGKIEDYLEKKGYEVVTSSFTGNPGKIRNKHNNKLRMCDAALIYYDKENAEWIKRIQIDLLKSLGLGRNKPISPKTIIIENELQLDDSLVIEKSTLILQSHNRTISEVMKPFITMLKE